MSIYEHEEFAPVPGRPGISARVLAGPEHGITAFFLVEDRLETGAHIPLHTHPIDEVLVVTEGDLTVDVGAETQVVSSGRTVVVPPGTPHRLTNHGPDVVHFLAAAAWNRATFYQDASHYLEGRPRG
jgi:quercetin dioxygenase-like cupin family protein